MNTKITSQETSEACGKNYVGTCRCGHECSNHPDAAHSADFCGDCGQLTCQECRNQEDRAGRCFVCVPVAA